MMSNTMLFFIVLLAITVTSKERNVEVVLLKYRVLSKEETSHIFQNAHYAFEVCVCSEPSSDPKLSSHCKCSDLKGRTVRESTPQVEYSSECLHNPESSRCLIASLQYEDQAVSPTYYIRVSANGYVLTNPYWQELPLESPDSFQLFGSRTKDPIKLTYVVKDHKMETNSTNPVTTTTTTLAPMTPTTMTMTTTWSPPNDEFEEDNAVLEQDTSIINAYRFIGVSNLWQLRQQLVVESLRDRVAPWKLDISLYKQQVIAHHNSLRALHGAPPLTYDPYVELHAQNWADYLGSRASCIAHDPNRRHGECLFYFGGLILPNESTLAALTTQSFYLESHNYNNYNPALFYRTGHFTQMIWKASRRIGVGVSIRLASGGGAPCRPWAPSYQLFVVVKYDPPGNVQSRYAYEMNVQPRIL